MQRSRIKHIFKRSIELGAAKTVSIIGRRINDRLQDIYWRSRALNLKARTRWQDIKRWHRFPSTFQAFLKQIDNPLPSLIDQLCIDANKDKWLLKAGLVFQDRFTILSGIEIEMPTINWHIDFRLAAELPDADAAFPAATYYKEIPIKPFPGWELGKDIKIPWEVGRLQHLPLLAYGVYREKKTEYYQKMQHSFLDWNAHNPPLLGPQWMCPMDVGIRAVNLVWSFFLSVDFIKHDLSFAQTLTASLYDHLLYLERNWEIYDYKTSNHYLGDLIGYFYLCYYFKKSSWDQRKSRMVLC